MRNFPYITIAIPSPTVAVMKKCLLDKLLFALLFEVYILLIALQKLVNEINRPLITTNPTEEETRMGLSDSRDIRKGIIKEMKAENEKWMIGEPAIQLSKSKMVIR